MLWGVSALKCSVFQKIDFSKFSINRTCCSIDRNCDKKLGLNLPGSITTIESNFRSIENLSESFFKISFFHVFFTISNFSKSYSLPLSSTDLDSSQTFVVFLPNISQGFCPIVPVRPLYPFLFSFIHFIHAFLGKFSNV